MKILRIWAIFKLSKQPETGNFVARNPCNNYLLCRVIRPMELLMPGQWKTAEGKSGSYQTNKTQMLSTTPGCSISYLLLSLHYWQSHMLGKLESISSILLEQILFRLQSISFHWPINVYWTASQCLSRLTKNFYLHWWPSVHGIYMNGPEGWLLWTPITGLILGLRSANERQRYKVTPSLIGWAQTWNQPFIRYQC